MSREDHLLYTCRACLQISSDVYPIFENISELNTNIASILQLFLVEVKEAVGFPDVICSSCFGAVQICHNFIQTFQKSQLTLIEQANEDWEVVAEADESQLLEFSRNCLENNEPLKPDENSDLQTETSASEDVKPAKVRTYHCPSCEKSFRRFKPFSRHVKTHAVTIQCEFCPLTLEPTEFSSHYETIHRYQCETCEKSFTHNNQLQRHLADHTNTLEVFPCPVADCWKTFAVKSSLKRHTTTVHGDKFNFLCNQCGASFKSNDGWRYHMKKHSGGTHLCMYCGRTFVQAAHLTYHLWRHTGIKPYNCPSCDKSFVSKKLKVMHLKDCGQNGSELEGTEATLPH